MTRLSGLTVLLLVMGAHAMDYHVWPAGDDASAGTAAQPFRTLARAAQAVQPGDTVWLHAGVYREALKPVRDGQPGRPITFAAAPGEAPVISACDPLSDWRDEGGGRWSAPLTWDLGAGTQLFAAGQPLTEARWPNHTGDLWKPARATAAGGSPTTLTDPKLPGTAADWVGATLSCAGGAQWICWSAKVTAYDAASHTLTFAATQKDHWYVTKAGSPYVLIGARFALDAPGEWWFDRAARRVVLLPPAGAAAPQAVEAKRRVACIDLSDRQQVHLRGLRFVGGGLLTSAQSADLRLEGLRGEWVAHSWQQDVTSQAVTLVGSRIVASGCEFAYSSGGVVRLAGRDNKLLNCYVHHGDYLGMWQGTLAVTGRRQVVHRCTVQHSGRDLLSIHGLQEGLIQYNDLSYAGWLTHDLGMTYGHNTDFAGTVIRYNRVHDNVAGGLGQGIYFDHLSHNVIIVNNLVYNVPDMPVQINNPGYFNLIAHNSAIHSNRTRRQIITFDHSHRNDLFGCRFLNNAVNAPHKLPPNAVVAGNVEELDNGYLAPAQGDLRIREDSRARGRGVPIRGLNEGEHPDPGVIYGGQPFPVTGHDFANPPADEPVWTRPDLQYTSRLVNGCFEFGTLEGWTINGSPLLAAGNGWGNRVAGTAEAPTGTSRYELKLTGAATVAQTVALRARTKYQLSGWLRVTDAADAVELRLECPGLEPVVLASHNTTWERVVREITTPDQAVTVTVSLRRTGTSPGEARADNLGLVEL